MEERDGIPGDIWEMAQRVLDEMPHRARADCDPMAVALRAILNERERAAQVAENFNRWDDDDFVTPEDAVSRNVTANTIARAIRNP